MEKCLSFRTLDVIKLSERHKSDLDLEDGIYLLLHGHISKRFICFKAFGLLLLSKSGKVKTHES